MRPLHILLLTFGMLWITSCDKEDHFLPMEGDWKLVDITGGLTGAGTELKFEVSMQIHEDEMVMFVRDSMFLSAKMSFKEGYDFDIILLDKKNIPNDLNFFLPLFDEVGFIVEGDQLLFAELCNDCFQYHFEKII